MASNELQHLNYAGLCLIAPGVVATGLAVVAMPIVVTIVAREQQTFWAALQAGAAMIPAVIIACFVLWMLALPGVYALGYPLLRLLHHFGIRSYLLHGLVGAVTGAPYLPFAMSFLSGVWGGWRWGDGLEFTVSIGLFFGFLVGLSARWAMNWRRLHERNAPNFS